MISYGSCLKLLILYFSMVRLQFFIVFVLYSSAFISMSLCFQGMNAILPYNIKASFSILCDNLIIPMSISTASLHVPYSHLRAALSIFLSDMSYLLTISSQYKSYMSLARTLFVSLLLSLLYFYNTLG